MKMMSQKWRLHGRSKCECDPYLAGEFSECASLSMTGTIQYLLETKSKKKNVNR